MTVVALDAESNGLHGKAFCIAAAYRPEYADIFDRRARERATRRAR